MVEQLRLATLGGLRVEHRHGDRWVRLEPSPPHDSAESDPERSWGSGGRLYRCSECDEQIRVDLDRDDRTPG
jgi:hypothetical protein